jgi:hypothetical protein
MEYYSFRNGESTILLRNVASTYTHVSVIRISDLTEKVAIQTIFFKLL